ncbi:right-handed parallel beta-helix repeat-containing protein [Candidatus Amarolinea dominans]|uniref:right-handed parallel beta-helix repeat-containing protein n=1 Tax=Candidatus Amarolinea dominans TaxID=3140696 RepID=UPI001DD82233|nr:right-handed parallel beta-helix repeat-containing protein [Anaerolineae bacterium]
MTIDASTAGVIVDGIGLADPEADGFIVSSIGNTIRGLQVRGFPRIGIHLDSGADNNTIRDNTIGDNGDAGIYIGGGQGNIITGNRIGTDVAGTIARGNHIGILLSEGASSNRIGGVASGERNIIAANQTSGVQIMDAGTTQNLVLRNYIGTDTTGLASLPNGGDGVAIFDGAHHNTVGGTTAAERNVIAYNGGNGVSISGNGTASNTVK